MKKRFLLSIAFSAAMFVPSFGQIANHVVISEVYGGGGNSGSTWKNDFIELYNPTSFPVNLNGWSVQYGSATGSFNNNTGLTALSGIIPSHGFFLIKEAQGTLGTLDLPTADVTGTIAISGTVGKIALSKQSTSAVTGPADTSVVDFVGFGTTASLFEGSGPTSAPSNTRSVERKGKANSTAISLASGGADADSGNGYDTNNNAADFVAQSGINPQNSSSPAEPTLVVGGNGTGAATILPSKILAQDSAAFVITLLGDGTHTLDSIIVTIPIDWIWRRSKSNVVLSGTGLAQGRVSVAADTIYVGGGAVTSTDTGKITISYIQAPLTPGSGVFGLKTGSQGGAPVQIASTVTVAVIKVVSIIDVHVNNSLGVCAAPYAAGAIVTASGIVTADLTATRTDIYIQDATAGINVFKSIRSYGYHIGDSVTVTGAITQFRGLTEIGLDSAKYIVHSSGRPLPQPLLMTAAEVNATFNTEDYTEQNEGRLVRVNALTYNPTNSTISDGTGTTNVFIPSPLVPPNGVFDLIGILKQFKPGTSAPPYVSDYEVQPRTQDDIILHPGPVIVGSPRETDIASDSVAIVWTTQTNASGFVKYGLTAAYTDSVGSSTSVTDHRFVLTNLKPSTIYHFHAGSADADGVNVTGDRIFSTSSPAASPGTVNVYFSKTINPSVALSETSQTVNISTKLSDRINTAAYSIDVCLYSLSGTVGSNIANALIAAKNRGVKIRVIGEKDNQGTTPWSTLKNNGITVIDDGYDLANGGNGLMHNKFVVFDNRDSSSAGDDWVWMGSWNATDPGNNNDAQNVVEIQDQAIANAYTIEFNEMWGSTTNMPNQSTSRFGLRKTDNTPHRFNIKGTLMESYFSPSDRTTSQIQAALNTAQTSVNVGLLTFTRDDLAQTLIAKKAVGKKVRIILDNNTDSGNEYVNLNNGGVDVRLKAPSLGGLFHHKYAIIDAENTYIENIVITGSHNWSNSAETSNNENTLIIHSKRIANLYLQEFKQRYIDAGGTDNIVITSVEKVHSVFSPSFVLSQNYPNPFNPSTSIDFQLPQRTLVTLSVFDVLGRQVATLLNEEKQAGVYRLTWDASGLPSGIYFCRMQTSSYSETRKMMLMK